MIYLFIILTFLSSVLYAHETEIKLLSGQSTEDGVYWDFYCSSGRKSGQWDKIRVPSCWELEGFGGYNYGHDKERFSETGTYRTNFVLPDSWKNRRIFIVFDGSMTDTKVKVNGKQAGDIHQGSFYRFKREITPYVSFNKENILEVEVSKISSNESVNEAERNADFWVFGGIFRPVYLEAFPKNFIEYTGFDARDDGTINLEVNFDKPLDELEILVNIFDLKTGNEIGHIFKKFFPKTKRCFLNGKIDKIEKWSAETPNMYKAIVTAYRKGRIIHTVEEKIGFRTIEVIYI